MTEDFYGYPLVKSYLKFFVASSVVDRRLCLHELLFQFSWHKRQEDREVLPRH